MDKNIRKAITSTLVILSLFLVAGCTVQTDPVPLIENVRDKTECLTKFKDAIWIPGEGCCFDINKNGMCDTKEKIAQTLCDSECSQPICGGENKKVFYDCVQKENGCWYYEAKGIVIGPCGVECIDDSSCKSDERCFNNKCEKDKCGDGSCGLYEDCNVCPKDCLKEGQVCCNKEPINGNCCDSSYCAEGEETCENNICTPIPACGDETCQSEIGEDCYSCPEDCQISEGQKCCLGTIIEGNCCSVEDCEEKEQCIDNTCVLIEEPPINETETNQTGNETG